MNTKRWILAVGFVVCVLSFNNVINSMVLDDRTDEVKPPILREETTKEQTPQYVPGEVIVKLKEKEEPQKLFSQKYSTRKAKHENVLSGLKIRYRLKDERPVFKGLHKQLETRNFSQDQLREEVEIKSFNQGSKTPKSKKQTDLLPIYILNTDEDVLTTCDQLSQDPEVEYAQPNYIYQIQMVPNDPYYGSLWGIQKIQCEQAWDISQGEEVVVAVIDTGVDYNHEDLSGNIWINEDEIPSDHIDNDGNGYVDDVRGWDFAYGDNNPMDGYGHGTHVSGTIAAVGNNGIGVIGVAPKAKIMAVKGLNDAGSGSTTALAEGIRYAAGNGAKVLSNSWGFQSRHPSDPTSEAAVDYAYDEKGCVVVFAAGNNNDDVAYYSPANYSKTIAVAATDQNDEKARFSNWGEKIDVSAPGVDVLSLRAEGTDMYKDGGTHIVGGRYYRASGTSMACPHVAGLAALILSKNPEFSNEKVRGIIQTSPDDIGEPGKDIYFGYGRINSYNALSPTLYNKGGKLQFSSSAYTANEDGGSIVITVGRFEKIGGTVTVDYATSDGIAKAGEDYTYTSGTLTFADGETSKTFTVTIIDDTEVEANKTVNLTLSNPTGENAVLGNPATAVLTIVDDEKWFKDSGISLPGVFFSFLAWGDYDNDSDLDLALSGVLEIGNAFTRIYRNNGDNTFTDISAGLPGVMYSSLAWGDYDNDGDLDLAICGAGITKIYRNNGDDTFTDINAGLQGVYCGSLAWGDYNNDGDLDLAICGAGITKIYRNNGDNTFTDINAGLSGVWTGTGSLAWGDYDNDGDLDLVVCGTPTFPDPPPGGFVTRIYRNNGDNTFTDINAGLQGVYYGSVAWGDYDNDGDLDLAICGTLGNSRITRIYKNNGNNTFIDIRAGLPEVWYGSVAWGDYENDGDLDLAVCGNTESGAITKIYRNNGDNTFTDIEAGLPGIWTGSLAWGDYDNDDDLDLAVCGTTDVGYITPSGSIARIYKNPKANAGGNPNIISSAPTNLTYKEGENKAVLKWNSGSDAETPDTGLYYNLRVGTTSGANDIVSGVYGSPLLGNYLRPKLASNQLGVRLKELPDGIYYWSVRTIDTGLKASQWSEEETFIVSTYTISGKVTLKGGSSVVTDVALQTLTDTVYPDTAGNYSFTRLGKGTYTVTPSLAEYHFFPASRSYGFLDRNQLNQDFTGLYETYDSDTDTLPDWWEWTYFGEGNLVQGPDDDPDADGWTNLEEYIHNTDPNDPESRPSVSISGKITLEGGGNSIENFIENFIGFSCGPWLSTTPGTSYDANCSNEWKGYIEDIYASYNPESTWIINNTPEGATDGAYLKTSNSGIGVLWLYKTFAAEPNQNVSINTSYRITKKTDSGSPMMGGIYIWNGTVKPCTANRQTGGGDSSNPGSTANALASNTTTCDTKGWCPWVDANLNVNITDSTFTVGYMINDGWNSITTYMDIDYLNVPSIHLNIPDVVLSLSGDLTDVIHPNTAGNYSFTELQKGNYTVTPSLAEYHFFPAFRLYPYLKADQLGQDFIGLHETYDSDVDTLPDWWEWTYFGEGNLSQGPDDDPDKDNYSNLEEYIHNTDPTDVTSKPLPSICGLITLEGGSSNVIDVVLSLRGALTDTIHSAPDGNYIFVDLLEEGIYTVTPSLEDYHFFPASRSYGFLDRNQLNQDFRGLHKEYDSDTDTLPDWWEWTYFGEGNLSQGPDDDPDKDGYPNIYEYYHNSNPTDETSMPSADIHVSTLGSDEAGNGSIDNPYLTIQKGIDEAGMYNIVEVADGIYKGEGNKELNWDAKEKHIVVRSENGADKCIIDCNNKGSGFYFNNTSQNNRDIIIGFTIRKAMDKKEFPGSGVYCNYSSPTIVNCAITDNKSKDNGGGIYCNYSSATITNCRITENDAKNYGGGIYCNYSSTTITNCTIADNKAKDDGGGIYCDNSFVTVTNSILWNNDINGPHRPGSQIALKNSLLTLSYSDVAGGEAGVCGSGLNWGSGNINSDPLFVDARHEDYHLLPYSPCVDVANDSEAPPTDILGQERVDIPEIGFAIADMGAYESPEAILISSCQVLDQPNMTYYLTRDLSGAEVTPRCISITAEGVTFDGLGHSIKNPDLEDAVIYSNANNVTIRNCVLTASSIYYRSVNNGYGKGIYITADNNIVENNTVTDTFWGIITDGGDSNIIQNNTLEGNAKGIHLTGNNNIVKENLLKNNNKSQSWGLGVWIGYYNQLINNNVYGSRYGLVLYDADNTLLKCNQISGKTYYYPNTQNVTTDNNCDGVDCMWQGDQCQ